MKAPAKAAPRRPAGTHVFVPWGEVELTEGEAAAIKAVASVNRVAFDTIVNKICGYHRISFAPGDDGRRSTDFAEGKRWVARMLLNIVDRELRPRTRGPEPGHVEPKADAPQSESKPE